MARSFIYTPSELRANLRAALGYAEAGEIVVIDRYGEKFILKHVPGESPYIPDFKQEYTAPQVDIETAREMNPQPHPDFKPGEKNNSEGKPSKRNICSQHLVDKDTCKLMKHKGKA